MYGGHITDDWDRRLCKTYLEEYMNPQMVKIFYFIFNIGIKFSFVFSLMVNFILLQVFQFHHPLIIKVIMHILMNFFHRNLLICMVYIPMLKLIFSQQQVKIYLRRFWKCNHVMQVQVQVVKVLA